MELVIAQIDAQRALTEERNRPDPLKPASSVNWQTRTAEDGSMVQVHPETGEVRPLSFNDKPLRGPRRASGVPNASDQDRRTRDARERKLREAEGTAADFVARGGNRQNTAEHLRMMYPELSYGERVGIVNSALRQHQQDEFAENRDERASAPKPPTKQDLWTRLGYDPLADEAPAGRSTVPAAPHAGNKAGELFKTLTGEEPGAALTGGRGGAPPMQPRQTAGAQTATTGPDPEYKKRLFELKAEGLTKEQAAQILASEGWDVHAGRKR